MSDTATIESTIDAYLEAYGEPDAARRSELIARVWAVDGQLIDPPLDASGREAIDGMAAAVQAQFPGHRFHRSTDVDAHHGFARYGWELVAADGAVAVTGVDIAEIDGDGLHRVVGFFGEVLPRRA
jgi:hypothetical protein